MFLSVLLTMWKGWIVRGNSFLLYKMNTFDDYTAKALLVFDSVIMNLLEWWLATKDPVSPCSHWGVNKIRSHFGPPEVSLQCVHTTNGKSLASSEAVVLGVCCVEHVCCVCLHVMLWLNVCFPCQVAGILLSLSCPVECTEQVHHWQWMAIVAGSAIRC